MKKFISIMLCLCLMLIPVNVMALNSTEAVTNTIDSHDIIETPKHDDITITHAPGSPEEQAIQKILVHKKAIGEEIPNETRWLTQDLIDGGVYYIKNFFSGKYLNVHYGVDANGTNVYQWTGDSSKEQKFKIVYDSATDSYKIYAMCSSNGTNRVLDVVRNGSSLASGQNVDIWTPVDHTAQRLILTPLIYDDLFHIQMLGNDDLYFTTIDKSNGTSGGTKPTSAGNVFIQTFDINDNQQWQFIPVSIPPTYAAPYGWLDEVNSNGIRGWAWCEDLPNTALKVEIRLSNSNTGQSFTIPLTANIYRADVAQSGFGSGHYGFHYDIDWSQYPAGSYTVRAFAGIDTPDTEIHDSPMTYNNSGTASSTPLTLNVAKSATLTAGSEHTYKFTPSVAGTYVVQTTGNTNTYGTVNIDINGTTVTETDDNDGKGNNFDIVFYATEGQTVEIKVRHYNATSGTGSYNIKVHRATAQIYTFNYPLLDINTTSEKEIPLSGLPQLGYNTISNINATSVHATTINSNGFPNFNSELVFFSGHGNTRTDYQTSLYFYSDDILDYDELTSRNLPQDMNNVRVALWSSCYSGQQFDENQHEIYSIAQSAYDKGAKVSIGWKTAILNDEASKWNNAFLYYLCMGNDVEMSMIYANNKFDYSDNIITSQIVYGDETVCIEPLTFFGNVDLTEFSNQINSYSIDTTNEYVQKSLPFGVKRYVRVINGLETNEYYDVTKNGTILHSENHFTQEDIDIINSFKTSTYVNNTFSTANSEDTENYRDVYYKINGSVNHVRILNSGKGNFYINLSNGKEIPRENIYSINIIDK